MALSNNAQASTNGIAVNTTGPNSPVTILSNFAVMPSVLTPLLEGIIDVYEPTSCPNESNHVSPKTEDKISYNCVVIFADEIRDNCGFMSLIENVIDEIDNQSPKSKDKFLWAINQKYKECKNHLILKSGVNLTDSNQIKELICENADSLIYSVSEEIFKTVSVNTPQPVEILKAAQQLIACYGFVNCKILESPDDNK